MARTSSTSAPSSLDRIGVGIDTARYGHRVSFLRPDRQPAAKPITVMETQAGYQSLREQLERLHVQHPEAHFHVRIDAAGSMLENLTTGETYPLRPLGEVAPILEAGGLFNYARKVGMLKP